MDNKNNDVISTAFTILGNHMKIITALVIMIISFFLAKMTSRQIKKIESLKTKKIILETLSNLSFYLILILGILIAFISAGFQIGSIIVVLSSLGIAIALGVKNILSQFASGLIITFSDLYNINDRIITNGVNGIVKQFDLLNTTLINSENIVTTIPNDKIIRNKLTNITRESIVRVRVEFQIKTNAGFDAKKFVDIIKKTVALSKFVVNDNITVDITQMTQFRGILFLVRAFVKSEDYNRAQNEIPTLISRVIANTKYISK